MEAKAVPRPHPPHYAPLRQNVQRFLLGLGSVERMTSLMTRLQVRHSSLTRSCTEQPQMVVVCETFATPEQVSQLGTYSLK